MHRPIEENLLVPEHCLIEDESLPIRLAHFDHSIYYTKKKFEKKYIISLSFSYYNSLCKTACIHLTF